jgi:hypothetical protein
MISVALLLWALGGVSIYVAYFLESPQQFAETAEDSANRQAYADYVSDIPFWAIAVGIVAALARLLGAIGLLMRRAWALPFYVLSAFFFLIALYRAFVLAGVAAVMGAHHIGVEAVFLALSGFAIWFARSNRSKGVLR